MSCSILSAEEVLRMEKNLRAEIASLEKKLASIVSAITDEGRMPEYHQQIMKKHRQEWPTLWQALDEILRGE